MCRDYDSMPSCKQRKEDEKGGKERKYRCSNCRSCGEVLKISMLDRNEGPVNLKYPKNAAVQLKQVKTIRTLIKRTELATTKCLSVKKGRLG